MGKNYWIFIESQKKREIVYKAKKEEAANYFDINFWYKDFVANMDNEDSKMVIKRKLFWELQIKIYEDYLLIALYKWSDSSNIYKINFLEWKITQKELDIISLVRDRYDERMEKIYIQIFDNYYDEVRNTLYNYITRWL